MVSEFIGGERDGNWTEIPDSVADVGYILETIDGSRYRLFQIDHKVGGHGSAVRTANAFGLDSTPADQYVIGKLELVP